MEKIVASAGLQQAATENLVNIGDWTDAAATVRLVTVPFAATPGIDPTTIPGNVTEFLTKTSGASVLITTVDPAGQSIFFPEPIGGWTFLSQVGTYPVTVTGYRVDSPLPNFLGCQNIPSQVISGPGQTVLIPLVRIPIGPVIFDGL